MTAPPPGGADGADGAHRVALVRAAADPGEHGIFPLLKTVEAHATAHPRIGHARLPAQDVVALAQAPMLAFPGTTLADVVVEGDRPRVRGYYLGLTGPMGPLPLHMTEVAYDEERYGRGRPFGGMLDLVAGRMLQFFYRAWADSQPAAQADRPDDDRFAGYVAAVSGAVQGADDHASFAAAARLQYAALFVGRRSAGAIEDALGHLLGAQVSVHPFEPRWRDIAPEDRSRLGLGGGFSTLGQDAVAGGRVRQVADAYRVTIRVGTLRDYEQLLPTGPRYALAAEALAAFAPTHLDWLIELEIAEEAAPRARLGGGTALGWTSWLGRRPAAPGQGQGQGPGQILGQEYRADTRLRRRARDMGHGRGGIRDHGGD